MPRNISFSMTTEQFINRTKTVTRRYAWDGLKPGTILCGVEKAMGLQKGEKIKRLGLIRVISVRKEPLEAITQEDVIKEGFPDWTPEQFIKFLRSQSLNIKPGTPVNRIEFEYLEDQ